MTDYPSFDAVSHLALSKVYQQTSQPWIPITPTRSPLENLFLRRDSTIAGRSGMPSMRIELTVLSASNVDLTTNRTMSSSMFTFLYTSSAKKCRMVATRDVPLLPSLVLSRSPVSFVATSSFAASKDASIAMSPMSLSACSRIQNPEAAERA
jgi:hypothetical protein